MLVDFRFTEGGMVNTTMLNSLIDSRGLKKKSIAQTLNITPASFNNKLYNRTEFKASEVESLSNLLGIGINDIGRYFFVREVECVSTNGEVYGN